MFPKQGIQDKNIFISQICTKTHLKKGWSNSINPCLDFCFVFSAPLFVQRNLFSARGIFCSGRYQPGCIGIFWLVEGTSQPVIILKCEKIPALLYLEKGPEQWVQALPWFSTCSLGLPASGTDLTSPKGLYSAPSRILKIYGIFELSVKFRS
jgi:hypothetical protein